MPGLLCVGHRRRNWAKGEVEKDYWKNALIYGSGTFRKRGNAIHTWHERRYEIRNDSLLVYYNQENELRGYLKISHVEVHGGKDIHLDKSGFCDFGIEPQNGVPMKIISMSEEPHRHLDVVFDYVSQAKKFCVLLNKGSNKNNLKEYVAKMNWASSGLPHDELVEDANGVRILHNEDSKIEFPADFYDHDSAGSDGGGDDNDAESSCSGPTVAVSVSDQSNDSNSNPKSDDAGDTSRSSSLSIDPSIVDVSVVDDDLVMFSPSQVAWLQQQHTQMPIHHTETETEILQETDNEAWYDSSPTMTRINYLVGCLECWVSFLFTLVVFATSILLGLVDISKTSYFKIALTQLLLTWIALYIQRARLKAKRGVKHQPTFRQSLLDIGSNVGLVFATMTILAVAKFTVEVLL